MFSVHPVGRRKGLVMMCGPSCTCLPRIQTNVVLNFWYDTCCNKQSARVEKQHTMKLSSSYKLLTVAQLTQTQLAQVAQRHLEAPMEWGDPNYDHPAQRTAMASSWHRQAQSEAQALFLSAVVDEQAQVVAFLWAKREPENPTHAHIRSLWVSRELRRKGVARALKMALEQWAIQLGLRALETEVHAQNTPMRLLNAELGYQDTYIRQTKTLAPPETLVHKTTDV